MSDPAAPAGPLCDPADLDGHALWHLASPPEWVRYRAEGRIEPASLDAEGFVHCSWGHQVAGTVARHFGQADRLLALRLEPTALGQGLVEENTSGGSEDYPHVYGPIPVDAVLEVVELALSGPRST